MAYAIYAQPEEISCLVRIGPKLNDYGKALQKAKKYRALMTEVRHIDHYGHETVAAVATWATFHGEPVGEPHVLQQLDFRNPHPATV